MKRLVITGAERYEVRDSGPPEPADDEILIAPLRVGICATDLELIEGSMVYLRNGLTSLPLTPGHEWVGRVVGLGSSVRGFSLGNRVVGECSIGCGSCPQCAIGSYHLCPRRRETGILGLDGALTELMAFPARAAHIVSETVDLEDAALVEPTAIAYRAVGRLGDVRGRVVLVVGAGTVGYLAAAVLSLVGGAEVAAVDVREAHLERLRPLGVRQPRADEVFDFVLEAAGSPTSLSDAIGRLGPGGRLVTLGLSGASTELRLDDVVINDQEILGSIGSPGVWDEVISLIESGRIRPSALVTNTFELERFDDAIELLSRREHGTGKVLIAPNAI